MDDVASVLAGVVPAAVSGGLGLLTLGLAAVIALAWPRQHWPRTLVLGAVGLVFLVGAGWLAWRWAPQSNLAALLSGADAAGPAASEVVTFSSAAPLNRSAASAAAGALASVQVEGGCAQLWLAGAVEPVELCQGEHAWSAVAGGQQALRAMAGVCTTGHRITVMLREAGPEAGEAVYIFCPDAGQAARK